MRPGVGLTQTDVRVGQGLGSRWKLDPQVRVWKCATSCGSEVEMRLSLESGQGGPGDRQVRVKGQGVGVRSALGMWFGSGQGAG